MKATFILLIILLTGCAGSSIDLIETAFDNGCNIKSFTERGSMTKIECK